MSYPFHPRVKATLRQAGWFPGRQVGEDQIAQWQALRPLFPAAEKALREFAGLYVPSVGELIWVDGRPRWSADYHNSFFIDPVRAWKNEDPDFCDDYAQKFGNVYLLGFVDYHIHSDYTTGTETLFMDVRGYVFTDYTQLLLIGESIEQAMENIILNKGRRRWSSHDDLPLP